MLVVMDLSVLFLAVPSLTRDLHPSATELLWITDVYGFLIAGALIVMGALGDRIGRRKVLLWGSAAFGVASILASLSTSGGDGPLPGVPLFVLSHRPAPEATERQTLVTTGIEDAIAAARAAAGDRDVALMGGGTVTAALTAGLVDEFVLHQVPVLLGAGRPFFQQLPEHVRLHFVESVPAPGVTHLRYEVQR